MSELRFPDLVLCAGTVLGSDVPERVKAAAEAGFDGITLWYDDYVRVKQAGLSDADLRALVRDHDLGVAEVDPLMSWVPDTSVGEVTGEGRAVFGHTEDEFYHLADLIGARSINSILLTAEPVPRDLMVESFAALCDRAAERGLLVHLEFLPWTQIPDVESAHEIVRLAGRENGGLMLDSWHLQRSGGSVSEVPAAAVNGIQISDAPAAAEEDLVQETLHRRRLPGDGDVDLVGLLGHLQRGGCGAPIGVEVFSDEISALPLPTALERVAESCRALLARAAIESP